MPAYVRGLHRQQVLDLLVDPDNVVVVWPARDKHILAPRVLEDLIPEQHPPAHRHNNSFKVAAAFPVNTITAVGQAACACHSLSLQPVAAKETGTGLLLFCSIL